MAKAKKLLLALTKKELIALLEILDDVSAMLGSGDDLDRAKNLKQVDKALLKNGLKRQYN